MKLAVIAVLFAMAGCSSLQYAGNATYTVKPFITDASTGTAICCEVEIKDGKERASLDLHVVKSGDNYDITLSERGTTAFAGQTIAAGSTQAAITAAAKAAASAALSPVATGAVGVAGAVLQ